jgi:two-component system LytT family response regulator
MGSANERLLDNVEAFALRAEATPARPRRMRCAFRSGDSTYYPYLDEVIWIEARRNYSDVHTCTGTFTVREILASLERRLEKHGFFRVQRSSILNIDHVVEIRRERRGRYAVVLSNGTSIVVPAAVKDRVEELLGACC